MHRRGGRELCLQSAEARGCPHAEAPTTATTPQGHGALWAEAFTGPALESASRFKIPNPEQFGQSWLQSHLEEGPGFKLRAPGPGGLPTPQQVHTEPGSTRGAGDREEGRGQGGRQVQGCQWRSELEDRTQRGGGTGQRTEEGRKAGRGPRTGGLAGVLDLPHKCRSVAEHGPGDPRTTPRSMSHERTVSKMLPGITDANGDGLSMQGGRAAPPPRHWGTFELLTGLSF